MKSMTGFGKSQLVKDGYHLEIELKSVNNRFLDCQFRMPREFQQFEHRLKNIVNKKIQRGRVECSIYFINQREDQKKVQIQWGLLDDIISQLWQAKETRYKEVAFDPEQILSAIATREDFFEVIENREMTEDLINYLEESFEEAVTQLDASRQKEGEEIRQVLVDYFHDFSRQVSSVSKLTPEIEEDHRLRLENKLMTEVGREYDEQRLLTEITLLIDRGDIHEELDRLNIHQQKVAELLEKATPIGRELDFLLQEMNREVNTIGSKSTNMSIKNAVVQMKTILEKIREQIQNVE
ncbi:YicC/YloC family endoribonuclease [Vagococcus elongatus]|uniref:YicC family protein n=1 Tax=Vagococcus elongatus TaxID=180344 RepID=A0A430AYI8_9ENTE|nr:YicC/YloC family endoribonuclease [Vagococcus elongatus]RSU13095.1 YicC family protein [Vagococcus elongatus]